MSRPNATILWIGDGSASATGDGDVYLKGSHFRNVLSVAGLVISAISCLAFFFLISFMARIKRRKDPDSLAGRYLNAKVMGTSLVCLFFHYGVDTYDRFCHEKEYKTSVLYLGIVNIVKNALLASADAALVGLLLWLLLPALLGWSMASKKRTKRTLWTCRGIVIFIAIFDTLNTVYGAVVFVQQKLIPLFEPGLNVQTYLSQNVKGGSSLYKSYIGIGAASAATFDGLYFFCSIIFAVLAFKAISSLKERGALPSVVKTYLPAIAMTFIARCSIDLAWSILVNVVSVYKGIHQTNVIQFLYSTLYATFSVVIFYSILRIVEKEDPLASSYSDGGVYSATGYAPVNVLGEDKPVPLTGVSSASPSFISNTGYMSNPLTPMASNPNMGGSESSMPFLAPTGSPPAQGNPNYFQPRPGASPTQRPAIDPHAMAAKISGWEPLRADKKRKPAQRDLLVMGANAYQRFMVGKVYERAVAAGRGDEWLRQNRGVEPETMPDYVLRDLKAFRQRERQERERLVMMQQQQQQQHQPQQQYQQGFSTRAGRVGDEEAPEKISGGCV